MLLFAAVSMLSMSSCEKVFDGEGDCTPRYFLQFVFDRNMLYNDEYRIGVDAFAAQVGSVEVYVFAPETGNFVAHFTDEGAHLRQEGYRLPVDLKPGEYDIIAWCGLAGNEGHFTIPATVSHYSELKCRMARSTDEFGTVYSDKNLNAVFHGRISHYFPDSYGDHTATVYLTKDTNYIQIALHHRNGGYIDPERFTVIIEDENGYLAHDNSLLGDEQIQYRPWTRRGGVVEGYAVKSDDETAGGSAFLVAELATSRLVSDHKASTYITVTDTLTGNVVFSIPLVKYILLMKSDRYSYMDDQEYLDREDEYDIMVFLENVDDKGWLAAQIVINGWHIVDNGNVGL